MTNVQLLLSIGIPTFAVLIGFLTNNARLGALDAKIDRVESGLGAGIDRIEADLGARIDRVVARLATIEGDLRQFYRELGIHQATSPTSNRSAARERRESLAIPILRWTHPLRNRRKLIATAFPLGVPA